MSIYSELSTADITQDFVYFNLEQETIRLVDLPLRQVPIVQANCSTYKLLSLLNRTGHP